MIMCAGIYPGVTKINLKHIRDLRQQTNAKRRIVDAGSTQLPEPVGPRRLRHEQIMRVKPVLNARAEEQVKDRATVGFKP